MSKPAFTRLTTLFLLEVTLLLTVPAREAPARHTEPRAKKPPAALSKADAATQARLSAAYAQLPLSFEANQGQSDPRVKFLSRGKSYSLFLTSTEAMLTLRTPESTN